MTQPDWGSIRTPKYDILVAWRMLAGLSEYLFRFAFRRTVHYPYDSYIGGDIAMVLRGTYIGDLCKISPLYQSFGAGLRPKIVFPKLTLTFARTSDQMTKNLVTAIEDSDYFSLVPVDIAVFVAEHGKPLDAETDLAFLGNPEPDGVKIYRDRIEMTLTDILARYDVQIPSAHYVADDYPDLEPRWEGKIIPAVFGKFGYQAENGEMIQGSERVFYEVPVVKANSSTEEIQVKLCEPSEFGIDLSDAPNLSFYRFAPDGSYIGQFDCEKNLSTPYYPYGTSEETGVLRLDGSSTVHTSAWEAGETIYLSAYGGWLGGNADSYGDVIENPASIWNHILRYYAGVNSDKIDWDSWTSLRDFFSSTILPMQGRRILTLARNLADVLEELCGDFGMITVVKKGKFYLYRNPLWPHHEAQKSIYNFQIRKDTRQLLSDPGRLRAGGAKVNYCCAQVPQPSFEELREAFSPATSDSTIRKKMQVFEFKGENYFFNALPDADTADFQEHGLNWVWRKEDAEFLHGAIASWSANEGPPAAPNLRGVQASVVKALMAELDPLGNVYTFYDSYKNRDKLMDALVYEAVVHFDTAETEVKAFEVRTD